MAHHNGNGGKSWNDRELDRTPLTTVALEEAAQAIVKTINAFPEAPGSDHKKGSLLSRLAYTMGSAFPTDMEGHPTLKAHAHNKGHLPATVGEIKQRIDRIANNLSDDTYMQDMCRAAGEAAADAAKQTTLALNKR